MSARPEALVLVSEEAGPDEDMLARQRLRLAETRDDDDDADDGGDGEGVETEKEKRRTSCIYLSMIAFT